MTADTALQWLASNEKASIDRLVDWLKIPSISTDPAYKGDCQKAAEWCAARLKELGFQVEVRPTGTPEGSGHPVVLATIAGTKKDAPHVLFYGHYDVQPADPLDLWKSPPFEPVIRDAEPGEDGGKRIVARGAVDDKGQVVTFLEACRAWKEASGHATNGVPYTVLIEGEEESGSANLDAFIVANKKAFEDCDVCLISDTGMLGRDKPAITYGVRGLAYTEITLHASNQDLHSGLWGGRCPNPITELSRVLAQLHDKKRRVTIPGFYDDVLPISKKERKAWAKLKFNAKAALKKIGLSAKADIGEEGYTAMEREWGRPTAEINGIWGGYTGKGAKTVIPAIASAKISFRLVANQKPSKIVKQFFKWLEKRTPPGCRWELTELSGGYGVTVPIDSPHLVAAGKALKGASKHNVSFIKSGGSIPVAGLLKKVLGLDTIFMGFGLDDDRIHSPNEKFELACFSMGCRAHVLYMDELGKQ